MKKTCLFCGEVLPKDCSICSNCHHDNSNFVNLSEEDTHLLHRQLHKNINSCNDRKNSGLTFVVTGSILLIIGLVFLYLSFRYNVKHQKVFIPASVEFVSCVVCLVLALTFLAYGLFKLFTAIKKKNKNIKILKLTKLK